MTKHEALLAASAGYAEFAASMAENPETDMSVEFANWLLPTTNGAVEFAGMTADEWRRWYEDWNW